MSTLVYLWGGGGGGGKCPFMPNFIGGRGGANVRGGLCLTLFAT